jgi:LAO/AO transport system kinase
MQKHATDDGVFIRSMASRGHLGGIAGATSDVIKVLDAGGFDLIIIETIGVGQTEIDVVEIADIVFLVLVPGLGDEIQALKAGVMEIGDIFIVNKSDRDDAAKVQAELEYVLHMKMAEENAVPNPVIMTSVLLDSGIDELLENAQNYLNSISSNGYLQAKRKKRVAREIKLIITSKINERVEQQLQIDKRIEEWTEATYNKKVRPYDFINEKLKTLFS